MEKLLLGLFFSGDELDIVHQQQGGLTVFLPELRIFSLPDGGDQLIGEIVALDVYDAGIRLAGADLVGNGIQQMGLAQAGVAIDKQGVIVLRRLFRHGAGGGIGHLVLGPHHIGAEGKGVGLQKGAGPVRSHPVIGGQLLIVQDLYLQIRGKNILQCGLDVAHKARLNGALLEGVAAMQHKGGVLHGHHLHLVEPGIDGGLGQLGPQPVQYVFPHVCD